MTQAFRLADRVRVRRDFERAYNEGARIHGRLMTVFVLPNVVLAGSIMFAVVCSHGR